MFIGGNDKETVKNIMRSDRKSRLDDYYDKIAGIADKTINTFILFKQYWREYTSLFKGMSEICWF